MKRVQCRSVCGLLLWLAGFSFSSHGQIVPNASTNVPAITSFSPQAGAAGVVVDISGLNFDPTPSNNIVYFGAVQVQVTAASETNLMVTVPAGATYAPITETVNGLTAYANQPFMPTFVGDGSGITTNSFAPRLDLASGSGPNKVVIADLDGDGKPDLIVADDYGNTISLYLNISSNGSLTAGSFAPRVGLVTPPGSYSPFGLAVADVDGDGKLDIISSDYDSSLVSVYRNTCTPGDISTNTFATRVDFATGAQPQGVEAADIDGDGKPDLLVANNGGGTVSILRNTGVTGSLTTNSFAPKVDITTGSACSSVTVGDLDGDGKPDVVTANNGNGTVSVLRNISTPGSIATNSFADPVNIAVLDGPIQAAIGDLDGDGKADLTVTFYFPQTVSVLRNTSTIGSLTTNSFVPRIDFALGGRGHTPAIADLDGDGKPDVAVVTEIDSLLSIFRNVSTPGSFTNNSFADRVDFSTGYNAWGVSVGDLDGDGRPDVVFANTYDNTISIYQNKVPFGGSPVITTQPTNQTVSVGGTASFSVTASGALPLTYQWTFNGTNILGATSAALTLSNVLFSQAGNYAVLVTNTFGSTNSASAILTVNPLPTPSGLTATAVSTNQINLSWTDNSTDEDGFAIERAPDSGGSPGTWAQIATVDTNVTTYGDGGLSINTKYWYRVRAYNAYGYSDYSDPASDTTLLLMTPSGLTATVVSTNQINLSWTDNSSNEDGFKIERAPDSSGSPGAWTQIATVGTNVTIYSNTGLSLNTKYWYRVRAYNTDGDSDYSNLASDTTLPLPPQAPSSLTATPVSSSQINLLWADNSGDEDGFKIERSTDGTNFTQIAQVLSNTTTYRNTGLMPGVTYSYRVRAYNRGGDSDASNLADATTLTQCSFSAVVAWGQGYSGQTNVPPGLTNAVAIAAGDFHSLALRSNGTVVGWGSNSSGQTNAPPGLTNAVAISAGGQHSLALRSNGIVVGWGSNSSGQTNVPPGLTNAVAIAAGNYHSLALRSDGTVVGWGDNGFGQTNVPSGLRGVVAIAAGYYHSLALRSDGTVVGWGYNASGQTNVPASVTNAVAIAAGYSFSLALKSDGTVVGWGSKGAGGPGGTSVPPGLTNAVAIAAGYSFSLALRSDGTVVGWGSNSYGQTNVPPGVAGVAAIGAGNSFSLALMCGPGTPSGLTATTVSASRIDLSWVGNSLGDGFKIERSTDGTNFVQIAQVLPNTRSYWNTGLWPGTTYYYRVCAYNAGGNSDFSNVANAGTPAQCLSSIVAWGAEAPPVLPDLTNVVAITVGFDHSLALKSDGTVVGWGNNSYGQTNVPAGLSSVVAIAAGYNHSLALKSNGAVVGWGNNSYGQTNVPAELSSVVAIGAGTYVSLALKSDGTVVGWGDNSVGATNVPVGLSGVVGIAAGRHYNLALKSDGTVVGWGDNSYGKATPPAGLCGVTAIDAGETHSLALTSNGTVVGWGNNSSGQTNVPAGLSSAVAIAAGYNHSLALKSNGTVVAWGNGSAGQTNIPAGLSSVVAIGAGAFRSLAMSCAPYAPSLLVATAVSTNQINLSWTDNSINENRFGIERSVSSTGPWTEIGSVDFDVTTYPDTGLSCGQTYYYRVRAYGAAGGSPYSSIATANTSPDDLDCDGIADSWTQQYFGHPTGQEADNSRATDDADGDGQNNLAEFRGGTDPTNSASAFRIIAIWPEDEDMFITWSAVGGKWYVVQTATNFIGSLSNNFYDLNPVIIAPGTGEYPLSVIHMGAATNAPARFYRVRLVP